MCKVHANLRTLLLTTAAVAIASVAHAQTATPRASTAAVRPAGSSSTELEELVVTAQKREQRLNDVGVTANVVTGADLKAANVHSLVDLQSITPNVQMKNVLGGDTTNISIRGIGLNDYAINNNPAAGVYVDGVYLVSPGMLTFGLLDLERIEVLKGPQGDLYGRNTTAGAVNIISRKPADTPEAEFEAGIGTYQSWHLDGAAGGPLAPGLTGRAAIETDQQNSGWQTNFVTGRKFGKVDRTMGRVELDWKPNDSLNVLLSGHVGYDHSAVQLYKVDNNLTNEAAPYANQPYVAGGSDDPRMKLKSEGVSLTVDSSLSEHLKLTSISAYEHFDRLHIEDTDGTSAHQLDGDFESHIDQYSQEVRLAYSNGDLNIIGGGFFSYDTVKDRDYWVAGDLLSALGLNGFNLVGNQYRQRTTTEAAFLHGEWAFTPKLTLVAGVRYTREHKIFDDATTFLSAGTIDARFNIFSPVTNKFDTSNVSGKVGLNFKATDHTLLYATISKGFKSGGFQGQLTFDPTVLKPFNDEELTSYELGLKSRLMPNLQLNASVFDYEYHAMQIYGPLFDSPVGVLFGIANVGNARVQGAEADVQWRPIGGLELRLGVGAIDPKVVKSIVPGIPQGSTLPNAPRLTSTVLVKYGWSLTDQVSADISVSGNYQSQVRFDIVREPPQAIERGYFVGNAEFGLSFGEHWRATVWAKNLFDKVYRTQALSVSTGWAYLYGAPRTVGLNLAYRM